MNCASCNTPLAPGNNICPNCGALNMSFNAPISNVQGDVQSNMDVLNNTPVSNGPVIQEGPAIEMPQVQQPQVLQTQVVQQPVQPQVVQTQVVQTAPVMEQPVVQETPAVEVLDDSAFAPMETQVPIDIPTVPVDMPTLGDGDGIIEGNESTMIVDDTTPVVEEVIPQMMNDQVVAHNEHVEMFTEDSDDEELQVTATMAPPTLNIQDDVSLTAGVGSLQNDNVTTYSNEELKNQQVEENKNKRREQDNVNFAIPSVSGDVSEVSEEVMDGGIPDMDVNLPTAGDGDVVSTEVTETASTEGQNSEIKPIGKKKGLSINLGSLNLKDIKSSKMLPLPFVLIGVVVFFIMGIVIGSTLLGTKTYTAGSYNRSKINASELPRVADGKNNTTRAGAFTFKIPKDYYYDRVNGGIAIYDNKDTFRIYIRGEVGIYDDLATAKTSVIKTLEAQKVTVNSYKETTLNKKNYVIIQGTTNVNNRLIAFTDAGHDYIFYIEIVTKDNTYNQDLVSIADDIVRNTKYNEKQSEMEMINVYDISAVVIKASMEYKKINNQNTN